MTFNEALDIMRKDVRQAPNEIGLAMAEQIEANRLAILDLQRKPVTEDGELLYLEIKEQMRAKGFRVP